MEQYRELVAPLISTYVTALSIFKQQFFICDLNEEILMMP